MIIQLFHKEHKNFNIDNLLIPHQPNFDCEKSYWFSTEDLIDFIEKLSKNSFYNLSFRVY
jgi:hypothetical protein